MQTISINYTLVWRFKNKPHIQVTRCKKVFNLKTGKMLKQTINGGSIGYWLDAKTFIPTSKINQQLELIKKQNCPF